MNRMIVQNVPKSMKFSFLKMKFSNLRQILFYCVKTLPLLKILKNRHIQKSSLNLKIRSNF